jgi:DNA invertase Pin-like site-specific DNA recombinase
MPGPRLQADRIVQRQSAHARSAILRVVIYLRISKDKTGDEHGVINQRGDAERLSASRGYQVRTVYCDNDISAFSGAPAMRR